MGKMVKEVWEWENVRYKLLDHMIYAEVDTKKMASFIGISINTLRDFLSMKRVPMVKTLSKIINYLNDKTRHPLTTKVKKDDVVA